MSRSEADSSRAVGTLIAVSSPSREPVATLILVETDAGWTGPRPEAEVRARVEGVQRRLAAPADESPPSPWAVRPAIRRADPADLGRLGRALAAHCRTRDRAGDPGRAARRHPRHRSREHLEQPGLFNDAVGEFYRAHAPRSAQPAARRLPDPPFWPAPACRDRVRGMARKRDA